MLEPILQERFDIEKASMLLEVVVEVRRNLALKPSELLLIDPLLSQVEKACHRRIRGDA